MMGMKPTGFFFSPFRMGQNQGHIAEMIFWKNGHWQFPLILSLKKN